MKIQWMGILSIAMVCVPALAQQSSPNLPAQPNSTGAAPSSQTAAQPANASPRIAPGSVIPVQLTKGIDAKKAKTGDQVEARVTMDLKSNNGDLIIAKDTKVTGRVTEAQAHSKDQTESQLGIAFDHAVMKDGHDVSLPMSIQAIISPEALNPANSNSNSANSTPSPSDSGGGQASMPGRPGGGMAGGSQTPHASNPSGDANSPDSGTTGNKSTPQITGNTQGVIGISDVKLAAPAQPGQGSMVTSEKKNVKLDSGTLMLLRVNQP